MVEAEWYPSPPFCSHNGAGRYGVSARPHLSAIMTPMDGTTTTVPLMHCYSGAKFNPFEPEPEDIRIADIAHNLSNVCRYGGACKKFYAVAQHSFICSLVAPPHLKARLLLHDASEAYI